MSNIARRVCVHGRVQGVFFRDSCTEQANSHGVTGWVRNDEGGTVSAHFEGAPEDVDALVAWCHSGPARAQVDDVEVRAVAPEGATDFTVR